MGNVKSDPVKGTRVAFKIKTTNIEAVRELVIDALVLLDPFMDGRKRDGIVVYCDSCGMDDS